MEISDKELRKMLNEAWDNGSRRKDQWFRGLCLDLKSARYQDVTRIIKAAQAVDWSKLSKPDNVEKTDDGKV